MMVVVVAVYEWKEGRQLVQQVVMQQRTECVKRRTASSCYMCVCVCVIT